MPRILAYYLYANLFRNIAKEGALTFADILSTLKYSEFDFWTYLNSTVFLQLFSFLRIN